MPSKKQLRRKKHHQRYLKDKMSARGMKRKCFAGEDNIEITHAGYKTFPSYSLQRKSLLDMSLVKLQLCHMLVEPNLCRSVLIANTVRQIQEEMTQDGTWQVSAQSTGEATIDRLESTNILCRSSKDRSGVKPSNFAKDFEETQPKEIISDLSTLTPAQTPLSLQSNLWQMENQQENKGHFQKSIDQIFETLESKNPNSVEDLFSDAGTSYYDLDTMLTGMMGNSRVGNCDLLDNFSAQTTTNTSNCKTELNEIDHIVEILVES